MNQNNTAYVSERDSPRIALSRQIFRIESRAREILGNDVSNFDYIQAYHDVLVDLALRGHQIMEKRHEDDPEQSTALLFRELRRSERFSWVDMVQLGLSEEDGNFHQVVKDFKPYQIFAALALTLIDEIPYEIAFPQTERRIYWDEAGEEKVREGQFEPMPEVTQCLTAAVYISEGMEALCIAENLHHKDRNTESPSHVDQQVAKKISEIARIAAKARHKENYAFRDDIFAWCEINMSPDRTIDSAAEEVSKKIVPVKFRFAQKCISEWKRLHSARRV